MTAQVETPLQWTGDPTVLVYAVRYALRSRGSHAGALVASTLAANTDQLPPAARRVITSEVEDWLEEPDNTATPTERATWKQALVAIQVRRAKPLISRKDLRR